MKKIAILVFSVLMWSSAEAGRVKTIILADTRDMGLHCGIKTNISMTYSLLEQAAAMLDMVDQFDDPILLDGKNCTKESLMNALASFSCSPDDAVLFFYFGHGARSVDDTSIFPQMLLHDEGRRLLDQNLVPLEDVADILKQKGGRFVLVFGDCCNVVAEGVSTKRTTLVAASSGISEYDPNQMARRQLERLLLESHGTVITVGSEVGQPSFYKNCMESPAHGFFTGCFWETLMNEWDEELTWEKWLSEASKATDALARKYKEENSGKPCAQKPIFRVDLATRPQAPQNEQMDKLPKTELIANELPRDIPPAKDVQQPSYSMEDSGTLKQMLVAISSEQNTFQYREQVAKVVLNEFFAPNARVEVVARNGSTIVESETAADFLERISLAQRLKNISVRAQETNGDGKIVYLLVHEVYEKKKQ